MHQKVQKLLSRLMPAPIIAALGPRLLLIVSQVFEILAIWYAVLSPQLVRIHSLTHSIFLFLDWLCEASWTDKDPEATRAECSKDHYQPDYPEQDFVHSPRLWSNVKKHFLVHPVHPLRDHMDQFSFPVGGNEALSACFLWRFVGFHVLFVYEVLLVWISDEVKFVASLVLHDYWWEEFLSDKCLILRTHAHHKASVDVSGLFK